MTACARPKPAPPPPFQQAKVSACVAPGDDQVRPSQVRSVIPRPSQSFSLFFQPATRAGKATIVQSPGGVGREKRWGPSAPAGQARGPISGARWPEAPFDETRRKGLASCRPTLGESLLFRIAQPLLDGAGLATGPHALRHVVNSPTSDRDSKIKSKQNNKKPTATAQHRHIHRHIHRHGRKAQDPYPAGCEQSADIILDASPRVSRNTVPPCHPLAVPGTAGVCCLPPNPSGGQHLTQPPVAELCVSVSVFQNRAGVTGRGPRASLRTRLFPLGAARERWFNNMQESC